MTDPQRMTYPDWLAHMAAAHWHPVTDIFDGIVEWEYIRGKRRIVISRAQAEGYWQLSQTPPPF